MPHCSFLLFFKLPLTQMRPSCMRALATPNYGRCNTSGISHSPHLSFFPQGRRLFTAVLCPSAPLKGRPSNPIFSRTAAHRSNSLKGCIQTGPAGGMWGVLAGAELTLLQCPPSLPLSSQALTWSFSPNRFPSTFSPQTRSRFSPWRLCKGKEPVQKDLLYHPEPRLNFPGNTSHLLFLGKNEYREA